MNRTSIFFVIALFYVSSCIPPSGKNNVMEEFYIDGSLKSTVTVKNGMRNGTQRNFDEKGRLLSTAEYVDDKREGVLINYNPNNGKPVIKAIFHDDIQEGPCIMNYQEGMLFRESTYVNGRVNGLITTYWPNGTKKAVVHFKNGMPGNDLKEFDKNGMEITQPFLVVEKEKTQPNTVRMYLSDHYTDFDLYIAELRDTMYFLADTKSLRIDDGIGYFNYSALKRNSSNRSFSVVAKVKTKYGHTLILQKRVSL